jgi:hypothetical protein
MTDNQLSSVLDKLGAVKDTMTVSRSSARATRPTGSPSSLSGSPSSLSPPCEAVAAVGAEKEPQPGGEGTGIGAGLGFGVIVRPLGVYVVKDGEVSWQPAMDVMRVILGGQLLGLAPIFALRHLLKRRRGEHRRDG